MEAQATSLSSSPTLPRRPFSGKLSHRKIWTIEPRRGSTVKVYAARREAFDRDNIGGRVVDENMIVLRKRIHEMKMIERNYEPPSNWMEWEKQCYTSYDSDICSAIALLQSQLMNTRPSLVLGMMAIVALSVPTSTVMILFHFMEMGKEILSGIHLT